LADSIVSLARRGFHQELAAQLSQAAQTADAVVSPAILEAAGHVAAEEGQDLSLDVLFDHGLDESLAIALQATAAARGYVWATRALGLRLRTIEEEARLRRGDRCSAGSYFVALLHADPTVMRMASDERRRSECRRRAFALRLVRAGGDLPVSPDDGSALHVAVQTGADEVVTALLALGASPLRRDRRGRSVLWSAAASGAVATTKRLLEQMWDGRLPAAVAEQETLPPVRGVHAPRTRSGDLVIESDEYDNPAIDLLAAAGVSWRLDWACARGDLHAVSALLSGGTPAGIPNEEGCTPLEIAAGWRGGLGSHREAIVDLLLAAGASPDGAEDSWREPPIVLAAQEDRWQIVRRLLQAGARCPDYVSRRLNERSD
jgi:hypothetical protein